MTKQLMAIITKHLIVVGEQRKTLSGIGEFLKGDFKQPSTMVSNLFQMSQIMCRNDNKPC